MSGNRSQRIRRNLFIVRLVRLLIESILPAFHRPPIAIKLKEESVWEFEVVAKITFAAMPPGLTTGKRPTPSGETTTAGLAVKGVAKYIVYNPTTVCVTVKPLPLSMVPSALTYPRTMR